MVKVKIYVEGGGDRRKELISECRRGFSEFFKKAGFKGSMPRIIPCGGRKEAYNDFRTAIEAVGPNEFIVLLVDSEDPVEDLVADQIDPWIHLKSREGDKWAKPDSAGQDNAHLMVQCMEAWFLADKEALSAFYGNGFREGALPKNPEIEKIAKEDTSALTETDPVTLR